MLNKGMLKNADGSPMKKDDFRIILKSDLIINSPYAYLSDLPDDLKKAIREAFLDAAAKDKAAFDTPLRRQEPPWQPVTNADYDKTIELIKFVDTLRKKQVVIGVRRTDDGGEALPASARPYLPSHVL